MKPYTPPNAGPIPSPRAMQPVIDTHREWLTTPSAYVRAYEDHSYITITDKNAPMAGIAADILAMEQDTFNDGTMWYVSHDMTRFALDAADAITSGGLDLDAELPSRDGVVCFADPIATVYCPITDTERQQIADGMYDAAPIADCTHIAAPIIAASWTALPATGTLPAAVWLNLYARGSGPGWPSSLYRIFSTNITSDLGDEPTPPEPRPDDADDVADHAIRVRAAHIVRAFWLLLRQSKLVEVTDETPTRQQRRAAIRRGERTPPTVRVVTVPGRHQATARIQGATDADIADDKRRHKVRYRVRGHAKQQFYGPKRGQRKRIWIDPHWRGPTDAPIHHTTTINLFNDPALKGDQP